MQLGYSVAGAMWGMTALSLGFVALRLYTRIRIIRFVGVEDYLYICTGVLLTCFTASIQVSVRYGLGQSFWILPLDDSSNAILWTYIANTFAVTGNAMAKLSLGFFLLRVVQMRAQKAALWVLIFVTAATSIALVVMLWNQTTPVKASWDPLRTPGTWNIQIKPMSVGLGGMVWSLCVRMGQETDKSVVDSVVECLRFLFRHLPLAVHLGIADASAGEDCACRWNEFGGSVSNCSLSPSLSSRPSQLMNPTARELVEL